jgi:methionine-rich copper-binding protein CopC
MRRLLTAGALGAVTGLVLLCGAGPAAAHDSLVSSDPAEGAQLASGPQAVTLTFDQPVRSSFTTVAVTGPGDTRWTAGNPTTSGNTVSVALLPLGPAGEYVIGYRIVSADGHPVTGEVRFQLTQAGGGAPPSGSAANPPGTASASSTPPGGQPTGTASGTAAGGGSSGSGGPPVWLWVAAAAVLLVAGIAVALRAARPAPPP